MAKNTFPAGNEPRLNITNVGGDLRIMVNDNNELLVDADGRVGQIYQEGDTLTINGSSDDITLLVPSATMVRAVQVGGDIEIDGVRGVELEHSGGDCELSNIAEVNILNCGADIDARHIATLRFRGGVGGGISLDHVGEVELESVSGDCSINNVVSVTVANVGGDLEIGSIASVLQCGSVGGDCDVTGSPDSELSIASVGGDLDLTGAGRVRVGGVGGDATLRDVRGNVELGNVGGDADLSSIGGSAQITNVSGDADLDGIGGGVEVGNVGSDLNLFASFPKASRVRANVGGDAHIRLPEQPNLRLRATVGGDVHGIDTIMNEQGIVVVTYGEGAANVDLNVGGDLALGNGRGGKGRRGDDWGNRELRDFGREMADLGREMANLGKDLGRDLANSFTNFGWREGGRWGEEFAHKMEEKARRMQERAEERVRRAEERVHRHEAHIHEAAERARAADERVRVRINEREWRLDPERLDRIKEQARRAAEEGLTGAMEAVERALNRMNLPTPPTPPTSPTSPTPATPPVSPSAATMPVPPVAPPAPVGPVPPIVPGPATGATIKIDTANMPLQEQPNSDDPAAASTSPEQEREAILRMVAEGRISPEEGDLLLESLGG